MLEIERVSDSFSIYWLVLPGKFDLLRWLKIGRIFLKILRDFRPDIVHFQHLISLPFFLPFLARSKGISTAIGLHDYWYICPAITLFHRDGYVCRGPGPGCAYCVGGRAAPLRYFYRVVKSVLRPCLMRWVLAQADLLLVPSAFVGKKYSVAGYAVRPLREFKYGCSISGGGAHPRVKGVLRFGYIGGFKAHKGPEVLIRAFSALRQNAELHLFGWGPQEDIARCKALAGADGRIFFHGEFDHGSIRETFSGFDILVMPSVWEETFGIAAQEAFFFGIPVIAAEIGGLPEQVEHGVNGFLFKPGDAGSLAAVLEECVLHYNEFIGLMDFNKNLIAISVAVEHMLATYRDLKNRDDGRVED